MASSRPSAWRFAVALSLIAWAGFAVRCAFVDQDYFAPDEVVASGVVGGLCFPDRWDTNWLWAPLPAVYRYPQYNFSSYHYLLHWWQRACSCTWSGPVDLATGRILNAVLGAVAIMGIGSGARRLGGEVAGICAALFLAACPLLVQDAHYLRCEAMLTAGSAVVLGLLLGVERPGAACLFVAGAVVGWLLASKPPVGLVLLGMFVLLWPNTESVRASNRLWGRRVLLLLAGAALGFVAGVPFGVLQPAIYVVGQMVLQKQYASHLPPFTSPNLAPTWSAAVWYFAHSLGWGTLALVVAGAVVQWNRSRRTAIALFLPLVGSWLLFGAHPVFSERSYSPFIPCAAVLVGVGLSWCWLRLSSGTQNWPKVLRFGLMAAAGLALLRVPVHLDWLLVSQGFSGREQIAQSRFLGTFRERYPDAGLFVTGVAKQGEVEATLRFLEGHRPLLVAVCDYYDGNSRLGLQRLRDAAECELVGEREGLFLGLPPCSLHAFISPKTYVLLFR